MKIKTPKNNTILLPMEVLPRLRTATAAELKVLLYLYAREEADNVELAQQLGITPSEAETAMSFWRGAGLLEEDDSAPKKAVPPSTSLFKSYDSQTIASYRDNDASFRSCCDLVAETFGTAVLNKNELSSLLYLYNYVGLPGEVISGVAAYCKGRGKTSMQYLMKTALSMYENEGVDTYEKFETYMALLEKRNSDISALRSMMGFGERELSKKEKDFFTRWLTTWGLSLELIRHAYETMVDNIHKVNLGYMDKVLERWYDSGFATVEDVQTKDSKPGEKTDASYGDGDEFFEAALKAGFEG